MPSPRAVKPLSASKAAQLYYHTDKNRSLRSIILDAKRPRQQSKTLSRGERKSWRYSSRNGVRNWDFQGVDDGSPKALRRLERFLSSRRPSPTARRSSSPKRVKSAKKAKRSPSPKLVKRSPSPKLVKRSPSPKLVKRSPSPAKQSPEKEFFARGKEGLVYRKGKNIVKEFLPNVPTTAFDRQVDFLRENSQSGVVPRLINVDRKNRTIEMEYLDGYVSLKEALAKVKKRKSEAEMSKLILALKRARERLRTDYDYADLSNFGNIAVKLGDKIKVKFFEGGKANRVRGTRDTVAELWLRKVVHEMKVSRNPVAKAILNNMPLPLK